MTLPRSCLRVLNVSQAMADPFCCSILGEHADEFLREPDLPPDALEARRGERLPAS